jgi:hypothetical protein
VLIALSALMAVVCIVPALVKLRSRRMQATARDFGICWACYRLIGVAELAADAGALIGLAWIPLGIAAAAGMALLLVGALTTHRRAGDGHKHAAPWSTAPRPPPAADFVPWGT